MATAGKIVLTASGKRGLRANGKVAMFNISGGCPECCDEGGCEFCSGVTPATFELVVSGVSGCCKPGVDFLRPDIHTTLVTWDVNGTHTLEQTGSCTWEKTYVDVWYETFIPLFADCDTYFEFKTSGVVTWTLKKTSATTWTLKARFDTTIWPSGLSGFAFLSEIAGQAENCTGDLGFTSSLADCGVLDVICVNGTATVSVP